MYVNDVSGNTQFTPTEVSAGQAHNQRKLMQAIRELNEGQVFGTDNEVLFSVDRGTRLPVVRIVNRETREVVQQLPPEYVLRMASSPGF
jgi:uncharacterized FlaG/YvyC family protein